MESIRVKKLKVTVKHAVKGAARRRRGVGRRAAACSNEIHSRVLVLRVRIAECIDAQLLEL